MLRRRKKLGVDQCQAPDDKQSRRHVKRKKKELPNSNSENSVWKDADGDEVSSEEQDPEVKSYVSTQFHQSVLDRISGLPAMKRVRDRAWGVHFQRTFQPMLLKDKVGQKKAASPLPETFVVVFNSCLEENSPERAFHILLPLMNANWFPPPRILTAIFSILLEESGSPVCRGKARLALTRVTYCHPPVTRQAKLMYKESFSLERDKKPQCWNFFSTVIRKCVTSKDKDCFFVFSTLVGILEEDFKAFLNGTDNPSKTLCEIEDCPLVCLVFWPDAKICVNEHCKELFQFLAESLDDDTILKLVQRLLSLVLECVRLETMSCGSQRELSAFSDNCSGFATDVIDACAVAFQDKSLVRRFLSSVEPVWFRMLISELLLQSVHNLTFLGLCQENLSLKKIVTHYMFPDFVNSPRKVRSKMSRLSRIMNMRESRKTDLCDEARSVHQRNRKGETKLHEVCRTGDAQLLQKMLSVPGVKVNARDNSGWTPLHNACGYGHLACADLLLQWRPQENYGSDECSDFNCFVDLCAASEPDGLTPVHIAVINEHLNVAELLLRHTRKGGKRLLQLKDKQGRTLFDLVNHSKMDWILPSDSITNTPEKEDLFEDYHSMTPAVNAEPTISQSHCKDFLEYLYNLLESYLSWYGLNEMNEAWSHFSEAYPVLRPDLVADMYRAIYGVSSVNETVTKRLYKDLKFIPKMSKYLERLESHFENLTGESRNCFHVEFLSLKHVLGL